MNILEAVKALKRGAHMRRPSMPKGHYWKYWGGLLGKNRCPTYVWPNAYNREKRSWHFSIEDILADDWEYKTNRMRERK